MAKPLSKMTKAELYQVIAAKDAELVELRARLSRAQSPVRRGPSAEEFRRRCEIRREASKRYFAAHPDKRSAAVAEILEWASSNA